MSDSLDREAIKALHRDHVFFSWSAQAAASANPIVMDRGEGVWFWDADGKKYIDFSSQLMNLNIGHQHPKVIQAIKDQADKLCFVHPAMATQAKGEAAAYLAQITPGDLKKVLWTLGGAEAIENAVKIARAVTGRQKIVVRYRSYHGATYGASTLSGDPRRLPAEPGIPGVVRVHDPYAYRCPFGYPEGNTQAYINHVIQTIEFEGPENVAAVLMESVTGSSGLIIPPQGYWQAIAEYCRSKGIMVICDEVMAGFGRTGKMFAIEHYDVVPDILVLAKGLTCGYMPLGAVIVREAIAKHFDERVLNCGLTYSGHPISCAAALATMKVYSEDGLIDNARNMGEYQSSWHAKLKAKHKSVGDTRNIGLFGVLELVKDRETREPTAPWNAKASEMGVMNTIGAKLRERGISTFVRWNMIFTVPPLCISKEELDWAYGIIDEVLDLADAVYTGK